MLYFLIFIGAGSVFAEGGKTHHVGSISDLKFYFINFFIFLIIVAWGILPMIKKYFREQHLLMKNHFHTASEKLRLAKLEKEKAQKEMDGLEYKISEMRMSNKRDVDVYRVRYKKEIDEKANTLEKDIEYQIEFEISAMNNNLYKNVIEKITQNVEQKVKGNTIEKESLSESLIKKAGLRYL